MGKISSGDPEAFASETSEQTEDYISKTRACCAGEIAPLTVCKIRDAGEVIIKYMQHQSFKEDMQTLWHVTEGTQDKNILQ